MKNKLAKQICSIALAMTMAITAIPSTTFIGAQEVEAADTLNDTVADRTFNAAPTISEDGNTLILPTAPQGWNIELFGSDREEVVALDGTISSPLNETTVKLLYKLTKGSETIETNVNATITIPAREHSTFTTGDNAQPNVLPALREWLGGSGHVQLSNDTRIVATTQTMADAREQLDSFVADLEDLTGIAATLVEGRQEEVQDGDIFFTMEADAQLGKEGYEMYLGGKTGDNNYIIVEAPQQTGILYAGISMLQILKQTKDYTLPKGITRDYPMYEYRGYMMDAARTFIPIEYLEDTMKQMTWYKMNSLSIHLSDNDIWGSLTEGEETHGYFRLESEKYPELTSKEGYYTKEEFRQLQYSGMDAGINVIPELDTPGHALAYTRAWPELNLTQFGDGKYLDVSNPETLTRITDLYDEYINGYNDEEPTFVGPDVNIGTDEYKYSPYKEQFRAYTDGLLKYIKSQGKNNVFWGSLTENAGTTEVMTDATMFCWFKGYADAKQSLEAGYRIVSMEDNEVYVIPGGGYYSYQYGREEYLYNNWKANNNSGWNNSPAPDGHPRVIGGQFALWNDYIGNACSLGDMSFRVQGNMRAIAEKCWANDESKTRGITYAQFKELGSKLGDAPNCDFLYTDEQYVDNKVVEMKDGVENITSGATVTETMGVTTTETGKIGEGIQFAGGESYMDTDLTSTGFDWTTSMWIKPDADSTGESILMEGKTGKLKLKQGSTNKIGYSVDFKYDDAEEATDKTIIDKYNHYFDLEIPNNAWTHVALSGDAYGVKLYINGKFIDELKNKAWPNYNTNSGLNNGMKMPPYLETLMLPTATIGSHTNAFKGTIDNLEIYNRVLTAAEITEITDIVGAQTAENLAAGKEVTASGNELEDRWSASKVTDGNTSDNESRWSSNYDDAAWLQVDLGDVKDINKVNIFWEAAFAIKYKVLVSEDGTTWNEVYNEEAGEGGSPKVITFATQKARYVKFQGVERKVIGSQKWGYSMYELEVYAPSDADGIMAARAEMQESLQEAIALYANKTLSQSKLEALQEAIAKAGEVLTDETATIDMITSINLELQEAIQSTGDEIPKNMAVGAMVTSENESWPSFSVDKIVDGDSSNGSRWAIKKTTADVVVDMTLAEKYADKTFNNIVIRETLGEIEDSEVVTAQIKNYKVQVKEGNTYRTIAVGTGDVGTNLSIDLAEEISAGSQLRFTFTPKGDTAGLNISEIEIRRLGMPIELDTSIRAMAARMEQPELNDTYNKLILAAVSDGYNASIVGTTNEAVIATDGTITQQSTHTDVTVFVQLMNAKGEKAVKGFVVKVPATGTVLANKSELKAQIKDAEALVEEDYTAETWMILTEKLVAAKEVFEKFDATQDEVDEVKIALEKAKEALVVRFKELPVAGMTATAGSAQSGEEGNKAIDNDINTLWHTNWAGGDRDKQYLILDLGGTYEVGGFVYTPRTAQTNGIITKYEIQVSEDGKTYTKAAEGTWANTNVVKSIEFAGKKATHVKLVSLESTGGFTSAAEVRVLARPYQESEEVAVTSVSVTPATKELKVNETVKLTAKVLPENASTKEVTWKSLDTTKAIVTADGTVTAKAVGEVEITATSNNNVVGKCTITIKENTPVVKPVESVTLSKDKVELKVGATETIIATVNPSDATDKTVTWATDKASVATVADGKITAVAEGTAKITATAGGKTATCTVTVAKAEKPVQSVTLSKDKVELKVGATETITATVNPSGATDKTVTWATDKASVATVADGKITAVAEGTAKITARAGEKTATCVVTVTKVQHPTKGWYHDKNKNQWKYYENNIAAKSKWIQVYGSWYYMGSDEYMTTKWQSIGGKWYYLGTNGKMVTKWQKIDNKWYYFNKSGAMVTKWLKIDGKWYYFNKSGAMVTNWYKEGNTWYYLKANGAMATGWIKIGGTWYYMNVSGKMQTGWEKVEGKWYYLKANGAMATGWIKDGGKYYFLNSSGAWTGQTR